MTSYLGHVALLIAAIAAIVKKKKGGGGLSADEKKKIQEKIAKEYQKDEDKEEKEKPPKKKETVKAKTPDKKPNTEEEQKQELPADDSFLDSLDVSESDQSEEFLRDFASEGNNPQKTAADLANNNNDHKNLNNNLTGNIQPGAEGIDDMGEEDEYEMAK